MPRQNLQRNCAVKNSHFENNLNCQYLCFIIVCLGAIVYIMNNLQKINDDLVNIKKKHNEDLTDFALESKGARIITIGNTKNYAPCTITGITIGEGSNGPTAMLRPTHRPGQCWAFAGSTGSAIIQLANPIKIDGVTLEHISKSESPTFQISTAPKNFQIWGLEDRTGSNRRLLGQFEYRADENSKQIQYFPIDNRNIYEFVEFVVLTNHGHTQFTCVYRLRVHGI